MIEIVVMIMETKRQEPEYYYILSEFGSTKEQQCVDATADSNKKYNSEKC